MKLILFLIYFSIASVERPTIPPPSIDFTVTGGIDFETFIEKRKENINCQRELLASQKIYKENLQNLNNLIQQKAPPETIDTMENKTYEMKKTYINFVRECGQCVTKKIENRIIKTPLASENWYISDGSCLVKATEEAMLKAYVERRDSLLKVSKYAVNNGGFSNILYFTLVDNDSGEKIRDIEDITFSPYYAYIGVKGPHILDIYTAATYYFKGEWKEWEENGIKHFNVTFFTTKAPQHFVKPEIFQYFASGKRKLAKSMELSLVEGSWYLNSKGYMRYYTAADFGFSIKVTDPLKMFLEDVAHTTLLETLLEMSERGVRENN